jgi:hypothetical protein
MNGLNGKRLKMLLAARGKADLIDLLVEQAADNEDLRRMLVRFVAPQADAVTLVSELNQIMNQAWRRLRTSREPWKLARPIAADLEPVLSALRPLIKRGHPCRREGAAALRRSGRRDFRSRR